MTAELTMGRLPCPPRSFVLARSSVRYRSVREARCRRIRDSAGVRVRSGYRQVHVLLRREGRPVNHKGVFRLCREEGRGIEPPTEGEPHHSRIGLKLLYAVEKVSRTVIVVPAGMGGRSSFANLLDPG